MDISCKNGNLKRITFFNQKMQSPEDSYTSLLSLISDLVTSIPIPYQSSGPIPYRPPVQQRTTMQIIHSIGNNAGLSMDHFIGRVHTWEGATFITFKERNNPRAKSVYTINIKTFRPTLTSPIQKQLSADLELELSQIANV
jgi:hypothetical protein